MRKIILFFLIILIIICLPVLKTAHALDDQEKRLQEIQQQISELEKQLESVRGQEKTLQSQLTYIDGQARLTELKVDETNTQIAKLEKEISDLSGRITRLSGTVDTITNLLLNRIIQTYKYGNIAPIDLLFSSNGFSDLLLRTKYIQTVQANDKKIIYQLQATKAAYNDQKTDKLSRQTQQEKLKKDLERYKIQLVEQKKGKEELLRITQNNEQIYQDKIRAAQQEQNAIYAILNGRGTEISEGATTKGTVIGYMIAGRSPCSSGTHLHFEVHQGSNIEDPNNFLANINFNYKDNINDAGAISPHGSWDWPIPQPIYVTQGYGMTPYARAGAYNGNSHTGIDMYSSPSLAVKAVRDGNLLKGGVACGSGTLQYKKIDHGDGTSSYYLHVI